MNKLFLIASLFVFATSSINASTGKISFMGRIVDPSCSVTTANSSQLNIILPKVSEQKLNASNKTADRTPFTINLNNCQGQQVDIQFEVVTGTDTASGRISNQSTAKNAAKNVDIQLVSDNGQPIRTKLNEASYDQNLTQKVNIKNKNTVLNYAAEYYATGTATPGAIASGALYTIIYQ